MYDYDYNGVNNDNDKDDDDDYDWQWYFYLVCYFHTLTPVLSCARLCFCGFNYTL